EPVSATSVFVGPDAARQRMADYTIADVLALPEEAPRVELRDGVMIVVPSPTVGHQTISNVLWHWFRTQAPKDYFATTSIGAAVTDSDTFEPDVLLLRSDRK